MPSLDKHQSQDAIKAILVGDSGTGKSGALASLAAVGYKLRILDFDNGLDVLAAILREKCPEALANVEFETMTNKLNAVGGKVVPKGNPDAWPKAMRLLNKWNELGPVESWGRDVVLIIDSLTFAAMQSLANILFLNGRTLEKPWQSDYGDAMAQVEGLLGLLYSDAIKCNVLIISHITYQGGADDTPLTGFPSSIGKALNTKIARYFNNCFRCITKGTGSNIKHYIRTVSDPVIALKSSNPYKIPPEVEYHDAVGGLATIFEAILGPPPSKKVEPIKVATK